MKNLFIANVTGGGYSWRDAARDQGMDPKKLKCITWHSTGGAIPDGAVAFFRVRPGDPANYLVEKGEAK